MKFSLFSLYIFMLSIMLIIVGFIIMLTNTNNFETKINGAIVAFTGIGLIILILIIILVKAVFFENYKSSKDIKLSHNAKFNV